MAELKRTISFGPLVLLAINASQAGQIPSCWDNPDVKEGSYIIQIETDRLLKDELLEIMDRASGRYISARR